VKALCVLVSSALLAAAEPAAAQTPAPSEASPPAKSSERPVLKLKLEEPARSAPRITFGPREGTPEQNSATTLPSLGGSPSSAYERPLKADSPSSPFPKDTNPGH
jgi:hypothetical protein